MADLPELLRAGQASQAEGDLPEAAAHYTAFLAAHPGEPNALHLLGTLRAAEGDLVEAERLLRAALAAMPRRADSLVELGMVLLGAGRPADALVPLTRAAALAPLLVPGLVGLVWAGGQRPENSEATRLDRRRSLPLAALAPLVRVPGVQFISLQKGPRADEAAHPPPGMVLHDWTARLHDFADTAALVQSLDLVIAVDTSVAHLAGALGRPVWLLNRFDRCWRWLWDRGDTPWYPTMRLFNQSAPDDWEGVLARVSAALAEVAHE